MSLISVFLIDFDMKIVISILNNLLSLNKKIEKYSADCPQYLMINLQLFHGGTNILLQKLY